MRKVVASTPCAVWGGSRTSLSEQDFLGAKQGQRGAVHPAKGDPLLIQFSQ